MAYKPFKMKGFPMQRNFPEDMDLKSQVVNQAVNQLMNEQTPMMKRDPNIKQNIKDLRKTISLEFNKKPRNDKKITELQRKLDNLIDIDAGYGPGNRPTPGDEEPM